MENLANFHHTMIVHVRYPSFRTLTPSPYNRELIEIECEEEIFQDFDLDQQYNQILQRRNLSNVVVKSVPKLHIRYPSFRPLTPDPHHREQIYVECEANTKNTPEAPVYSYHKRKDQNSSTVETSASKVSVSYPSFCTLTSNPINSEQIEVECDEVILAQEDIFHQNNRNLKINVLSRLTEDPARINPICYTNRKQINYEGVVNNNNSYQKRKEFDEEYISSFKRRKLSTVLEDSETLDELVLEGEPIFKIVAEYDEKTKLFCKEGHKMDLAGLLAKLAASTDESLVETLTVDNDESIVKVDNNLAIVHKLRTLPFFKDHKTLVRAYTVSDWGCFDRVDSNLPEGFKVKERRRESGSRVDREFVNPDMTVVFRSKVAVAEYVKIVNNLKADLLEN